MNAGICLPDIEIIDESSSVERKVDISIYCRTYNHVEYIESALLSFLHQNTDNFTFEIIIFDDASTDGTTDIVRRYAQKYGQIVKALIACNNTYSHPELWQEVEKYISRFINGRYVAMCEGDDCWIDNNKLIKQFKQIKKGYSLVVHNAVVIDFFTNVIRLQMDISESCELTEFDIISRIRGNIPTASMFYDSKLFLREGIFFDVGVGDYPTILSCFREGKVYYINQTMSVYRLGHKGSWTNTQMNDNCKKIIHCVDLYRFLEEYNQLTKKKYDCAIKLSQTTFLNALFDGKKVGKTMFDGVYLSDRDKQTLDQMIIHRSKLESALITFCKSKKHILVFGTGKKSSSILFLLKQYSIIFDSFLVSNSQTAEQQECMGKNVMRIADIPYPKSNTGIVIAVGINVFATVRNEIIDSEYEYIGLF